MINRSNDELEFEVLKSELALYRSTCPNCGGLISDYRLKRKLPCNKCLPEDAVRSVRSVYDSLVKLRELGNLKKLNIMG